MRLVRWTTEASDQLEAAVKDIQRDDPTAARNVAQAVIDRIEQLATLPRLGKFLAGTRAVFTARNTTLDGLTCCTPRKATDWWETG